MEKRDPIEDLIDEILARVEKAKEHPDD